MSPFNFRLPLPPLPNEYYEEAWDYAGEVGLAYQDLIRKTLNELDPMLDQLPFHMPFRGHYSLKLDVVAYPTDDNPVMLSNILQVLVDACTFAQVWDDIPLEQHIRYGGGKGGYLELKISDSKIIPLGLIDGCNPHTGL
jgi:hypothetical protein